MQITGTFRDKKENPCFIKGSACRLGSEGQGLHAGLFFWKSAVPFSLLECVGSCDGQRE